MIATCHLEPLGPDETKDYIEHRLQLVGWNRDPEFTVDAFDAWDGADAVGDLARRSGTGDAQAWRAAELTRALLALEPGALLEAADADGLPTAWFELPAVRAATGWKPP